MATVSGNKNAEMVHVGEIQQLTGYIREGFADWDKKTLSHFLDESAMGFPLISISAGYGALKFLFHRDLIKALDIKVCKIARLR